MYYYTYLDSPLKPLLLVSDGYALMGLYLNDHRGAVEIGGEWVKEDSIAPFPQANDQLTAYFAGTLRRFTIPLALHGTPFLLQVWDALQAIPYGTTLSYTELARRIGRPASVRAVGQANARNPISIIVPCHRVVGAHGALRGYGGGLHIKAALLSFEAAVLAGQVNSFSTHENQPKT